MRSKLGAIVSVSVAVAGCGGAYEASVRADLADQGRWSGPLEPSRRDDPAGAPVASFQTGLSGYLGFALARSPEVRAAFERWRAAVLRISRARRLPDPSIGFSYFIRSVETRVGPQRARLSLAQAVPWPAKLTSGADAASAEARAAQRRFDATALVVARQVSEAYWDLWQVRRLRDIHLEHLDVIRALSESVRARVSAGAAVLADLQQVDLTAARLDDSIRGMGEEERGAEAVLRAAVGAPFEVPVPTPQAPGPVGLPAEGAPALAEAARRHPSVERAGLQARAAEARARAHAADRYPSFTLGADWIITGRAAAPGVDDSGQDAIAVGLGLGLPLWQGSYADGVAAERADARARLAEQRGLADRALAALTTALSDVRDAYRRAELYRDTLVPQAETAYASVLGAYTVGRGTAAQALLAQRDLLELRIELERARADHARAWARLEEVAGRAVAKAVRPPRGEDE